MEKFLRATSWLSRLILLPPIVIFTLVALRYIAHPAVSAAAQGIMFTSGFGVTIARVGFGGFPLGCVIFLATCLISRQRVVTGLTFVAIMVGILLCAHIRHDRGFECC